MNFGCFSADGRLFACGGDDKKATVHETAGWTAVKQLPCEGVVKHAPPRPVARSLSLPRKTSASDVTEAYTV